MAEDRSTVTRRLAAILIADVVGYTRLMERDDSGTFARLRNIRDEVVDPAIVAHDGRIVSSTGDGLMAEFTSALSAVRAAVHVQREMASRNAGSAAEARIEYRIGVNLGDVMVDGDELAGDGINVAARLETLCEPGAVCVSGSVREQVHGTLDVAFVDIGEQQVKNIARPIRAFAVRIAGAEPRPALSVSTDGASPKADRATTKGVSRLGRWTGLVLAAGAMAIAASSVYVALGKFRGEASSGPPALSVGVLPLVAQGGDMATAQRAESLTRDLTSQLAFGEVAWRIVPASPPPSGSNERNGYSALAASINVRYLLDGSIQPKQDATEIRLRAVHGASGEQVWSEAISIRETTSEADQRRALRKATNRLKDRLGELEIRRVSALERAAMPMDLVLQAEALNTAPKSLDRFRRQEALYEGALERDPDLVPALLGVFGALDGQLDVDPKVDRVRLIQRMDQVSSTAVKIERGAAVVWETRSGALMYMGRWDAALEANSKAMELDPDAAYIVAGRAWSMSMMGRPADAVTLAERAVAMDPPGQWWIMRVACEAHLLLGQYDAAIAACEKAAGRAGDDFDIAYFLAAAYAHKGLSEKATEERNKILRSSPGFTIETLRAKQYSVHPEYVRLAEEHWYSGLRKAGIPEK